MKVRVSLVGHVVVDGYVDALDVDATTKDVSGDTDTGLELLELLVPLDTVEMLARSEPRRHMWDIPLLLADTRVDRSTREVALAEKPIEFRAALSRTDKDDDLVELQAVEKIVQFAVLLTLIELDVELLQAVQGQLLLVVHVDLERILHELLAHTTDLLGKGGGEHHHLLVGRGSAEDRLNVVTHVCLDVNVVQRR